MEKSFKRLKNRPKGICIVSEKFLYSFKKAIVRAGFCVLLPYKAVSAGALCTLHLHIDSAVTSTVAERVADAISLAEKRSCASVFLEIDTQGGPWDATRRIAQEILNSPLPFLCLVSPKGASATSAGAIILQACHVNGALRGTNMGASTPISWSGADLQSDIHKKAVNDTVSFVKSLSQLRGRNDSFAEEIVTKALSVTADEAFSWGAVDFLGDTKEDFLNFAEGRQVETGGGESVKTLVGPLKSVKMLVSPVKSFPKRFRHHVLGIFDDPQLLLLLFFGSLTLIYFELTHPGTFVPGIVGGIGLIISLMEMSAFSINWGAWALILVGLILLAVELFVPSFGIFGVGGMVSFVLGNIYLFSFMEMEDFLPWPLILFSSIIVGLILFGMGWLTVRTARIKRNTTAMGTVLGKEGEITQVDKSGKKGWLLIHGENWRFQSEKPVKEGDIVKVIQEKRMYLTVEKTPSC